MSLRSWLGFPFLFSASAFFFSASAFFFLSSSCFLSLLAGLRVHSSSVWATSLPWYLQWCLARVPVLIISVKFASGLDSRVLVYVMSMVSSRVSMHSQSCFQPKAVGSSRCLASKSGPMTWIHDLHSGCGLEPRVPVMTMCVTSHSSHFTSLKQLCSRISCSRVTRILMKGVRSGVEATAWILEKSSHLRCVPRRYASLRMISHRRVPHSASVTRSLARSSTSVPQALRMALKTIA
mmetsp:Transcript_45873/g.110423  ORF Transcript_45873/g.110423 Transcript_45873/m.110423 type:complete len:236 (+) Transcript_45873:854-1561(+)